MATKFNSIPKVDWLPKIPETTQVRRSPKKESRTEKYDIKLKRRPLNTKSMRVIDTYVRKDSSPSKKKKLRKKW